MVGVEGMVRQPLPLMITVVSIEPRNALSGEKIVWEVSLKNDGPDPITLPWSGDLPQERDRDRDIEATLTLLMTLGPEGEGIFAPVELYGNHELSSTLKILRPGEEVRVRGKGTAFPLIQKEEFFATLPREVSVRANFYFRWGVPGIISGVNHFSTNSIPLTIRKRE